MDVERALARRAQRQHGLVTRRQAQRFGLSARQIDHRVATGRWTVERPGVYAGGWVPPSIEQAVLAVVLAIGQPCALSHGTAAVVWGLPVPRPARIYVATPRAKRVALEGVAQHRRVQWWLDDVTVHRRIPVTTVARTVVDCGAALGAERLGQVVDEALRRKLLRLEELSACVGRLLQVRARSLRPVRTVLEERSAMPERGANDGELQVLEALRRAGLPLPVSQHRVVVGGRTRQLDYAYPAHKIAIEFDGFGEHGLLRSTFDDDRVRGNALALSGWLVLHFTTRSTAAEIAERTREALALAAARPG
jgi:hypothetical protein